MWEDEPWFRCSWIHGIKPIHANGWIALGAFLAAVLIFGGALLSTHNQIAEAICTIGFVGSALAYFALVYWKLEERNKVVRFPPNAVIGADGISVAISRPWQTREPCFALGTLPRRRAITRLHCNPLSAERRLVMPSACAGWPTCSTSGTE